MKKYFQYLTTAILLFTAISGISQNNADDLLKRVIDKTRSHENIRVDFGYQMINEKAGIDELKKGTLYLKGDAYKLSVESQIVLSDGKTVWTYLDDSNEVMVSDAELGEDAMTPSTLLTSYYKEYKASFVNDKANTAKDLKTIELKPTTAKKFTKIQIGVDEKKIQLVNLAVFDNGGNKFVYDLSKMTTNIVLAQDFFTFKKADYPGVEVVDMR